MVLIFLQHFAFPYLKVRNGVGLSTFFWAVATPVSASLSHPISSETVKCYKSNHISCTQGVTMFQIKKTFLAFPDYSIIWTLETICVPLHVILQKILSRLYFSTLVARVFRKSLLSGMICERVIYKTPLSLKAFSTFIAQDADSVGYHVAFHRPCCTLDLSTNLTALYLESRGPRWKSHKHETKRCCESSSWLISDERESVDPEIIHSSDMWSDVCNVCGKQPAGCMWGMWKDF